MGDKRNFSPGAKHVVAEAISEINEGVNGPTKAELKCFFDKNGIDHTIGSSLYEMNPKRFLECDNRFVVDKENNAWEGGWVTGIVIARGLTAERARQIIQEAVGNMPVNYNYDDNPYPGDNEDDFYIQPSSGYESEDSWWYETVSGRRIKFDHGKLIAVGHCDEMWWLSSNVFRLWIETAIDKVAGKR